VIIRDLERSGAPQGPCIAAPLIPGCWGCISPWRKATGGTLQNDYPVKLETTTRFCLTLATCNPPAMSECLATVTIPLGRLRPRRKSRKNCPFPTRDCARPILTLARGDHPLLPPRSTGSGHRALGTCASTPPYARSSNAPTTSYPPSRAAFCSTIRAPNARRRCGTPRLTFIATYGPGTAQFCWAPVSPVIGAFVGQDLPHGRHLPQRQPVAPRIPCRSRCRRWSGRAHRIGDWAARDVGESICGVLPAHSTGARAVPTPRATMSFFVSSPPTCPRRSRTPLGTHPRARPGLAWIT